MFRRAVLLLAVASLAAAEPLTEEGARKITAEALALVEKETGAKLDPAPVTKIASASEIAEVLTAELLPQMTLLQPTMDEDGRRKAAGDTARLLSVALFGKYAPGTNTIYFVVENFDGLAKAYGKPELASHDGLRTIAIHELAHAADHARYKVFDRIGAIKSIEELTALNAVIEGHAQYVTWRVLKGEADGEARFASFESVVGAVPPGMSEGERIFLEALNMQARFSYHDGFEFFRSLEAAGTKDFVEAVFKAPPKRKDVILHPERFGKDDAGPAQKDLAPLWEALKAGREEGWNAQVIGLAEVEIRAAMSDMVAKEKVDAAIKGLHGGQLLVLTPQNGVQGTMVAIGVTEYADEAAARRMFDLGKELLEAKDLRLKEGPIRITEAKYGEFPVEGASATLDARKTVAAGGQEFKVRDTSLVCGRFMVEVVHSLKTVKKKELRAMLEKILSHLNAE